MLIYMSIKYIYIGLLHCRQILHHLSYQGSTYIYTHIIFIILLQLCSINLLTVMFYKLFYKHWISEYWPVAEVNIQSQNTEVDFCEPLATFSLTEQYITFCYVCFCLKIPCIIYTVDTNTRFIDNGPITHAWMTHI